MDLHCLASLEADPEVLDQLTVVAQGLGGVHDAFGFAAHRRRVALFARDVGVERQTVDRGLLPAEEGPLRNHADGQIGAVVAFIVQLGDTEAVEVDAAVVKVLVVCLPRGYGIVAVGAGCGQDRVPQLSDGLVLSEARKDLLCPGLARDGGDAPLLFVFHLVIVRLHDRPATLVGFCDLALVHALQTVGVRRDDADCAGQSIHVVLQTGLFPFFHRAERFHSLVAHVELVKRLMAELHRHLSRSGLVAFVHEQLHELRLVELAVDDHVLPLLDVHAHAGDQARVIAKRFDFHNCILR